jgi:hypothetical protein
VSATRSGARSGLALAALALGACSAGRMDVVGLTPDSLELGLLAHWPCDAEGGYTVVDSSGNRHDGALDGASWVAGQFGGALHFDVGSSVTVSAFPQATTGWSVALWYRASASGPEGPGNDVSLLVGNEEPGVGGWAMKGRLGDGGRRVRFEYPQGEDGGTSSEVVTSDGVPQDTWVHLVAVVDGVALRLALYQDGEPVDERSVSGPILPGRPDLYFGRSPSSFDALIGDLDDIAIFSRALVQAEVGQLYAAPAPSAR